MKERSFLAWTAIAGVVSLASACQAGGFSGSAPGVKQEKPKGETEEDEGDSEDSRADEPTMVTGMFLVCGPETDPGAVQYANATTYGCAAVDPRTKRRADAAKVDGVEAVLDGGVAVKPPMRDAPSGSFWHVLFTLTKSARLTGVVATAHVGAQAAPVAAVSVAFAKPDDPSGGDLGTTVVIPPVTTVTPPAVAPQKLFVTSTTFAGDFGGRAAADKVCQDLAFAAGLNAQVVAFLADGATPPQVPVSGALYNTRDEVVSKQGLLGQVLVAPLYDEAGQALAGPEPLVWSGTSPMGDYADPSGEDNCSGWKGKGGKREGIIGNPALLTEGRWLSDGALVCDDQAHFYCLTVP